MKKKFAKLISVFTVAPFIAFLTITWIYFANKSYFDNSIKWYFISLFFLTFMPISAYLLEYVIPSIKRQGRDGERKLAFIMAVLGYVLGTIFCFIFKTPKTVLLIFLSYFVSGIILAFVNKVVKIKASGHGCGLSGPMTLLIYFIGKPALSTLLFLPAVFWARLSMKRHTYRELVLGTLIGFLATGMVLLIGSQTGI